MQALGQQFSSTIASADPSRASWRSRLTANACTAGRACLTNSRFGIGTGSSRDRCSHPALANAPRRRHDLTCRAVDTELDADAVEAINEASNSVLRAMLANDRRAAADVAQELGGMCGQCAEAGEHEAAAFLRVLRAMLDHRIPCDAEQLQGLYAQAFDRICNQVAGSDWRLTQDGQPEKPDEPRFSTWEEALGGGRRGDGGSSGGNGAGAAAQPSQSGGGGGGGGVAEETYYRLLEVGTTATAAEIKSAFRCKALALHPDVNAAADAAERFSEVSQAYDVLSDAEARRLYDRLGAEGMARQQGAAAGSGNAREAWDEFKPFKRENKRTKARDAARAAHATQPEAGSSTAGAAGRAGGGDAAAGQPQQLQAGDVVEYPLSEVVRDQLRDGRSHGVALLVGRNLDRGDARTLPDEALDLCEVEPLRQEDVGSAIWVPDELQASAFVRLGELRSVPVAAYDGRFDKWTIEAALSAGCGGPELGHEVML